MSSLMRDMGSPFMATRLLTSRSIIIRTVSVPVSFCAVTVIYARGAPVIISSRSRGVRNDLPTPAKYTASKRLVLPRAFAPTNALRRGASSTVRDAALR